MKAESQERVPHIKKQMHVKEENASEQKSMVNTQSASQMSFQDANELLRFYTPAQDREELEAAGREDYYESGDYVTAGHGGSAGFASGSTTYGSASGSNSYGHSSPHTPAYGMHSPHQYSYKDSYDNGSPAYGGAGMGMGLGAMTSSPSQQMGFQPSPYRSDTKGRQESPLLVE